MKKLFLTALLIATLTIAFLLPTGVAFAAEENDVTIETDQSFSGNEMTVDARISRNDGFITLFLCVDFDSDVLTLTEVKHSSAYSSMLYLDNTQSVQSGKATTLMFGYAGEGENNTELSSLFTLRFRVKEGATNGKHKVTLSVAEVGYKPAGADSDVKYNAKYGSDGVSLEKLNEKSSVGVVVAEEEYLINNGVPAPEAEGSSRTLVIVLCVIGGIVIVAGAILAAYFINKKKQKQSTGSNQ